MISYVEQYQFCHHLA